MKKKKVVITLSIVGIFILTFIIYNYINTDGVIIASGKSEESVNSKTFSLMLETSVDSGEYQVSDSNSWPGADYEYNRLLSYCENGSTITWNKENNSVNLKIGVTDKCYIYFDVAAPEVTLTTNNQNDVFNPSTPATLSCSGSTSSYNQKYGRIEVSQVNNKYANCTLTYETPNSKDYLNQKIINMAGTTQGTGQVVNENGYRYEGKNPNNYIWFNNELWRIIGAFDEESHGQSGQNLVKIIRNESIGGLAWNNTESIDWSESSLMRLLNSSYLNSQDGTNDDNCYGNPNINGNCNYVSIGINNTYRPMIENVTWFLGGSDSKSITTTEFYNAERGNTVNSGDNTTMNGFIGLIYPSDYGYSVPSNVCDRNTKLDAYRNCAGGSWLRGKGFEWTLTAILPDRIVDIQSYGNIAIDYTTAGYAIRPVLYLNSNVYVIDGTGTINDPYIIGI